MKKRLFSLLLAMCMMFTLGFIPVDRAEAASQGTLSIVGYYDYNEAADVVAEVNRQRAANGLSALAVDSTMSRYAMARAAENAVYYSHTRPDGTDCFTIYDDGRFHAHRGENIAAGYASAATVMNAWMNSEGHRKNILSSDFRSIGVGCFYQADGTKTWVQLFSTVSPSGSAPNGVIEGSTSMLYSTDRVVPCCETIRVKIGTQETVSFRVNNAEFSRLKPVVTLQNASYSVVDPAIAAVDAAGVVRGVKEGLTKVTVTTPAVTITGAVSVWQPPRADNDPESGCPRLTWGPFYYESDPGSFAEAMAYGFVRTNVRTGEQTMFQASDSGKTSYEYTDTSGVVPGETYTYELVLYTTGYSREYTGAEVTVPCICGRPKVTASTDDSGNPILTWNVLGRSVKYEIWRSTSQNGSYAKIGTTTSTSYRDAAAEAGSTYYYKVRGVDAGGTAGGYSAVQPLHIHSYTAKVTAPTCTAKGYTMYTCACGDSYKDNYTDALGHSWNSGTVTKSATYTTEGSKTYTCTRCGATKTETSPKLTPAAPALSISKSNGKITISWNAVDGANKYWIYRSTDGVNFKYYDTTTKTTYTNSSVTSGTKYYYKVKAIKTVDGTNYASGYSAAKSTIPLTTPALSISKTAGKIKLSWGAVKGATKYWIYRSTDGVNFKYYDSTTKTSYTNSSVTSGTRYYYKVRAVKTVNGTDWTSSYSAVKSTIPLATPTLSAKLSSGKVYLSWGAVTGATKYWIYRSTDGVNFKYYDSTTKTSYTNSSVTAGHTYYYKVKAVKTVNGTDWTGDYSNKVSIKR